MRRARMSSQSIVAEILSSAGKLEKEEFADKIAALSATIEDFKIQVQEILSKRLVEFVPRAKRNENLEIKSMRFTSEVETLKNIIQNELVDHIRESADEFKEINTQLEITEATLNAVKLLVEIHDDLSQCKASMKRKDFLAAVRYLQNVKEMKRMLQSSLTGCIKLIDSLENEYLITREGLVHIMEEIWREYASWDLDDGSDEREMEKGKSVQLTITGSTDCLEGLVRAMHSLQYLNSVSRRFATHFNKHIIHRIIMQKSDVFLLDSEASSGITLKVSTTEITQKKPRPTEVFEKLSTAFSFLQGAFGSITVSEGDGANVSFLHHLGPMIYKDFCPVLIQECLSKALPSHRKDLASYNVIVEATTHFYETLLSMGITCKSDDSLIKYAQNVDTLFANKMCRELLCQAKKIIMEDLYDSKEVQSAVQYRSTKMQDFSFIKQEEKSFADESKIIATAKHEADETRMEDIPTLSNLMKFPMCQISTSIEKLVNMLYSIMEEASGSSEQCAERLFTTARNIVHLYCDLAPCYHKDSLESLPEQSALFHNNCMYMAHHLMKLGHQFRSTLALPLNDSNVTFLDLVLQVKKLGIEVFLAQMRIQRKQLISILAGAGDFRNIVGETKFVSFIERAIKQCTLQLEHLRKVWHGVLPLNVRHKSLGMLLNTLVEEIISKVTMLEDLPAVNATYLIAVLGIIKERAPGLFELSDANTAYVELQKYVPKWMKFQELLLVLSVTMQDILDRWASGKGPLAQEFTVDEAKQLIRALFQNTDRRAAVLAKIK